MQQSALLILTSVLAKLGSVVQVAKAILFTSSHAHATRDCVRDSGTFVCGSICQARWLSSLLGGRFAGTNPQRLLCWDKPATAALPGQAREVPKRPVAVTVP